MATIGHVAVGLAAARFAGTAQPLRWPFAFFWVALSLLPDADVASRWFGIAYGEPLGHRGATHSIAFAVVLGTGVALASRRLGLTPVRTAILATAVVLSHPLLDMLTFGARGCALLWPFDVTRYLADWRPLAASPIGMRLLSPSGLYVMATETIIFAPVLFLALRPRGSTLPRPASLTAATVAWGLCVWLISLRV